MAAMRSSPASIEQAEDTRRAARRWGYRGGLSLGGTSCGNLEIVGGDYWEQGEAAKESRGGSKGEQGRQLGGERISQRATLAGLGGMRGDSHGTFSGRAQPGRVAKLNLSFTTMPGPQAVLV
jgi:hypothetical protein